MATLIKDRSVLKHRAYYTVHLGSDQHGKIVGSVSKAAGRGVWWNVRTRNSITGKMEDDLGFLSFAEAKQYALGQAAIEER
jgi:hypothetical protein